MELIDSTLVEKDFSEVFPPFGKFNLDYAQYRESNEELDNLNIELSSHDKLFIINIDDSRFDDNFNRNGVLVKDAHKKVAIQALLKQGFKFSDIIFSINDRDLYRIVSPVSELKEDSFTSGIIEVTNSALVGEDVLLLDDEKLCGPYTLMKRVDGVLYVKPSLENKDYLKTYYSDGKNATIYTVDSFEIVLTTDSPEYEDLISDDKLITDFVDFCILDESKLQKDKIGDLISTSPFLKEELPDDIKADRAQRVSKILSNLSDLSSFESELLDKLKSKAIGSENTIVEKESYDELIQQTRSLAENYETAQSTIISLQNQINELNSRIEELQNNDEPSNEIAKQELQELEDKKVQLLHEIESIDKTLSDNKAINEFGNNIISLTEEIKYRERRKKELNDDIDALKNTKDRIHTDIKSIIEEANYAKVAFDPYISSLMLEKATDWYKGEEDNSYKSYVSTINSVIDVDSMSITKEELRQYLYDYVRQQRDYKLNEIINIYTCIAQGFITFFAGNPGSGKTSICDIVSNSLNLKYQYGTNYSRYASVSVERGWTSKRDLIGYYNPLTQKYDKANGKIYDALRILNEEKDDSLLPYFILLDEANLSQIEYYWSEFMKSADLNEDGSYIDIGEKDNIYIPKTLRFLATVNIDETTEQISPRLIDRSWIIKLPERNIDYIKPEQVVSARTILWKDFSNTFIVNTADEVKYNNVLQNIYKLFEKADHFVSRRIRDSIEKYLKVTQNLMEDSAIGNAAQQAIDFAVVQRLLPKINGTFDKYEELFNQLKTICDTNNLIMTKAAIERMEKSQEQNMGYCQYLC